MRLTSQTRRGSSPRRSSSRSGDATSDGVSNVGAPTTSTSTTSSLGLAAGRRSWPRTSSSSALAITSPSTTGFSRRLLGTTCSSRFYGPAGSGQGAAPQSIFDLPSTSFARLKHPDPTNPFSFRPGTHAGRGARNAREHHLVVRNKALRRLQPPRPTKSNEAVSIEQAQLCRPCAAPPSRCGLTFDRTPNVVVEII